MHQLHRAALREGHNTRTQRKALFDPSSLSEITDAHDLMMMMIDVGVGVCHPPPESTRSVHSLFLFVAADGCSITRESNLRFPRSHFR